MQLPEQNNINNIKWLMKHYIGPIILG